MLRSWAILVSFALSIGLAACSSAAGTVTPTQQPGVNSCGSVNANAVTFESNYDPSGAIAPGTSNVGPVSNLTFSETAFSSSDSTSYQGYVSGNTLNICTNRTGTTTPVNAVMGWMAQDGVAWAAQNALGLAALEDKLPVDLNFAVEGTLGFTYPNGNYKWSCDVIVGQGHTSLKNNWWMFTTKNAASTNQSFAVLCSLNGAALVLTVVRPGQPAEDNSFMFTCPGFLCTIPSAAGKSIGSRHRRPVT